MKSLETKAARFEPAPPHALGAAPRRRHPAIGGRPERHVGEISRAAATTTATPRARWPSTVAGVRPRTKPVRRGSHASSASPRAGDAVRRRLFRRSIARATRPCICLRSPNATVASAEPLAEHEAPLVNEMLHLEAGPRPHLPRPGPARVPRPAVRHPRRLAARGDVPTTPSCACSRSKRRQRPSHDAMRRTDALIAGRSHALRATGPRSMPTVGPPSGALRSPPPVAVDHQASSQSCPNRLIELAPARSQFANMVS